MEPSASLFAQSSLLKLSASEIEAFQKLARPVQIPAGQMVFREGDPPDHIYLLDAGHVKIYRTTQLGKTVTVGIRKPVEVIGIAEVLSGANRCCFAETVDVCRFWRMNGQTFIKMLHARPDLAVKIAAALGERLRNAETMILNVSTMQVDQRLAKLLLSLLTTKGVPCDDGQRLCVPLTQQELASMIGTCRQTVTTTLRRFQDEGIIITRNRLIQVVQVEKLTEYANF